MGTVWIKHDSEITWSPWLENQGIGGPSSGEGRTVRVKYFTDQNTGPWFWLTDLGPRQGVQKRCPETNELLWIMSGTLVFQGRKWGPGTVACIARGTGFGPYETGPDGLVYMIIRCAPTTGVTPHNENMGTRTEGPFWIKHESEIPWDPWHPGDVLVSRPNDGRTVRTKYFTDQSTGPWFWLAEFGPNQGPKPHSHGSNEVLYIVQGDIKLGSRMFGAGTYIYIEKGTQYQFQAGPQGMIHMNIRAADTPGMTEAPSKKEKAFSGGKKS